MNEESLRGAMNEESLRGVGGEATLSHLGVAVFDLDAAARFYQEVLGLPVIHREEVAAEGVRVAFIPTGGPRVELLESLDPDSPVGRFLAARGEGIHHVAFRVRALDAALQRAAAAGYEVVAGNGGAIRTGAEGQRVAFLHPRQTHGVLIELIEG